MIFVTVGTHEQQFNRLIKCVDELKGNGIINEDVVIQSGYSDYTINNCEYKMLFSFEEVADYFKKARIIITHGGPSSIIQALQDGKIPIVVPRLKKYGEHINNHQLSFCRAVNERYNNIVLVEETEELKDAILNYDELSKSRKAAGFRNNEAFVAGLGKIVEEL